MMEQILGVLDNSLLQGLNYGIAAVGIAIAFRILKYPDLTADGAFLIGASTFGALVSTGHSWLSSMLYAVVASGLCGLTTALLFEKCGVNRILSGILTSMMCYSIAFWILSGRPNINLTDEHSMFSSAQSWDANAHWSHLGIHPATIGISLFLVFIVTTLLTLLLRSEFGVVLRATGETVTLVEELGRQPFHYYAAGLVMANALIGLAGCLVSARQGFVDVNMAFGTVITLVASLVVGEELLRLFGFVPSRNLAARAASGVVGASFYFFLYLLILRLSILGLIPMKIQPTDLKLMSALIVVFFAVIRRHTNRTAEQPEEVLPI